MQSAFPSCAYSRFLGLFAVACLDSAAGNYFASAVVDATGGAGGEEEGFLKVQSITASQLTSKLHRSFERLSFEHNVVSTTPLEDIEASMRPTFASLPKISKGRLAASSFRYLVHGFLAQHHGWLLAGLTPHRSLPLHWQSKKAADDDDAAVPLPDLHEAEILRSELAPVEFRDVLREASWAGVGFSLRDAVLSAACLEHLVIDDSARLVDSAYERNGHQMDESLNKEDLQNVLLAFAMMYEIGKDEVMEQSEELYREFLSQASDNEFWAGLKDFMFDTTESVLSAHHVDSYQQRPFSRKVVSQIVHAAAHRYGQYQNAECNAMKTEIMQLDHEGYGRVPLSRFYSQPEKSAFKFEESVDYLRRIGALDETHVREPHVIIPNYLVGPSNCVNKSEFYSACCVSECDAIMKAIEDRVGAPTASAELVLIVVSNISSTTLDAPREFSDAMVRKLMHIASGRGGQIALHGRLFAQWLHFAFPYECSHPGSRDVIIGDDVSKAVGIGDAAKALTVKFWQEERSHKSTAQQRQWHVDLANASYEKDQPSIKNDDENPLNLHWSDEEALAFIESRSWTTHASQITRTAAQIVSVCSLFAGVLMTWASGTRCALMSNRAKTSHFL